MDGRIAELIPQINIYASSDQGRCSLKVAKHDGPVQRLRDVRVWVGSGAGLRTVSESWLTATGLAFASKKA